MSSAVSDLPEWPWLQRLDAVAAAVISARGRVVDANIGLTRIVGTRRLPMAGDWLLRPGLDEMRRAAASRKAAWQGTLHIDASQGNAVALRGRARLAPNGDLILVAEWDVEELERLNDTLLALNADLATNHRAALRARSRPGGGDTAPADGSLRDDLLVLRERVGRGLGVRLDVLVSRIEADVHGATAAGSVNPAIDELRELRAAIEQEAAAIAAHLDGIDARLRAADPITDENSPHDA